MSAVSAAAAVLVALAAPGAGGAPDAVAGAGAAAEVAGAGGAAEVAGAGAAADVAVAGAAPAAAGARYKLPRWRRPAAAALLLLTLLFGASPLPAGEVLMSKSGFANWLTQSFVPREQTLADLTARTAALESRLAAWELNNLSRICLWPDRAQVEHYAPGGVLTGTGDLDVPPRIREGRTMVPLRFVAEALGAEVLWNPADRTVTYLAGSRQIVLTVEQKTVLVNGRPAEMDTAPLLIQDRTMVPVRFVSQWLGALVKWEAAAERVDIYYTQGGLPLISDGNATGSTGATGSAASGSGSASGGAADDNNGNAGQAQG